MTHKNLFRRAKHAIKYGTVGAVGGTLLATVAIPAMGLVAHGMGYLGDDSLDNYSIKNRFETAYCFDTPESHRYYYQTPIINGYEHGDKQTKEPYLASPYATYGATAAAGIAGAVLMGGAGIVLAKRKENER